MRHLATSVGEVVSTRAIKLAGGKLANVTVALVVRKGTGPVGVNAAGVYLAVVIAAVRIRVRRGRRGELG